MLVKCGVVAQQHPRVLKQGRHSIPQHKCVMLNLRETGKEEEKEGEREEKKGEREGGEDAKGVKERKRGRERMKEERERNKT